MVFEVNEHVRLKEYKGSMNEYARIKAITEEGKYWVTNLGMPYSGTISVVMSEGQLEKIA